MWNCGLAQGGANHRTNDARIGTCFTTLHDGGPKGCQVVAAFVDPKQEVKRHRKSVADMSLHVFLSDLEAADCIFHALARVGLRLRKVEPCFDVTDSVVLSVLERLLEPILVVGVLDEVAYRQGVGGACNKNGLVRVREADVLDDCLLSFLDIHASGPNR